MDTPLVTSDGFPRSDIDVAQSELLPSLRSPSTWANLEKSAPQERGLSDSEMTTRIS